MSVFKSSFTKSSGQKKTKEDKVFKKGIILLSGGLDSTTVLAIAKSQGFDCYALSFLYVFCFFMLFRNNVPAPPHVSLRGVALGATTKQSHTLPDCVLIVLWPSASYEIASAPQGGASQ